MVAWLVPVLRWPAVVHTIMIPWNAASDVWRMCVLANVWFTALSSHYDHNYTCTYATCDDNLSTQTVNACSKGTRKVLATRTCTDSNSSAAWAILPCQWQWKHFVWSYSRVWFEA